VAAPARKHFNETAFYQFHKKSLLAEKGFFIKALQKPDVRVGVTPGFK
jgi:hypothetical protein